MRLLRAPQTDSYQRQGQADHHYYGDPGDQVEPARVGPVAHEVFLVDQQDHEDQDEGQQHAVEDLREQDHFYQREAGNQDHAGATHNQQRVEGIENGRFAPAAGHATMMKNAITEVMMQPTMTSMRDSAYSLAVMPFSTTAACR